jgi:hypothetical protein
MLILLFVENICGRYLWKVFMEIICGNGLRLARCI